MRNGQPHVRHPRRGVALARFNPNETQLLDFLCAQDGLRRGAELRLLVVLEAARRLSRKRKKARR